MKRGSMTNRLDFDDDRDYDPNPGFLFPDRDPDSGCSKYSLFTITISIDSQE